MIGFISHYAVLPPPPGWLQCGGQAVSRLKYAELNAVLAAAGYPYGNGDGTTTFNIPDCRGRVLAGPNTMGGDTENRLTGALTGGVNGAAVGNVGGAEGHTLLDTEVPPVQGPAAEGGTTEFTPTTDPATSAHNNVQPTIIIPVVIYSGVLDGDSIGT